MLSTETEYLLREIEFSRIFYLFPFIIVVFLTGIFQNLDLGRESLLRFSAIELELLKCRVRCLESVIVVRLRTYYFCWRHSLPRDI